MLSALDSYQLDLIASGRFEEAHRRRAIVLEHVVAGRPVEAVAKDLHLSPAQFYRERRAVCERLARAFEAKQDLQPHSACIALQPDIVAIAKAARLMECCETSRALELLDDVAQHASDPAKQIEAICRKSEALSAQLAYAPAERQIDLARSVLCRTTNDLPESEMRRCHLQIDLATAFLAFSQGRMRESRKLVEDALIPARRDPAVGESAVEHHIEAFLFAAEMALRCGYYKAFRDHLGAAQSLFSTLSNQSLLQKARIFWLSGFLANDKSSGVSIPDAHRFFLAAQTIAEKEGLIHTCVDVTISLAQSYAYDGGDPAAGLRYAVPAVDIALQTRNPMLIGPVCVDVANMRRTNHEYDEALKLLEIAGRNGKLDPLGEATMYLVTAEAYVGLNRFDRASHFAGIACELAARQDNRRLQGSALRVSALACHGNRQAQLARERIAEALELAERYGVRYSTAATYLTSSIITGNREHARLAKALIPHISSA